MSTAPRQLLLRTLEGRTVVVWWPSGWSSAEFIQRELNLSRYGGGLVVRLADGRRVSDACVPDAGSTLHLTLPIKGGKGGFGKAIRDLGRGYVMT
jgi:hypothetical protein